MMVTADRGAGRRRVAVAALIVALHAALALLLTRSRVPAEPPAPVATMTVVAVPAAPVAPQVEADAVIGVSLAVPEFAVASSETTASPPCDLLAPLGRALQQDPAVIAELAATTATDVRAVMVWNGGWAGRPETDALRRALVTALAAAPADCLDEAMTGPRLIFLTIEGMPVSIAVGSGTWNWRQLLSSDQHRPNSSL